MTNTIPDAPNIVTVYLQIAQYPILAKEIHEHMRAELFARGIISSEQLEAEVKEKAILSQRREGLSDPLNEEAEQVWEERRRLVRDYLTDFYFAYNLPLDVFTNLVNELLAQRVGQPTSGELPFNPELAPLDMLLTKAQQYEALPEIERAKVRHHLEEINVVLIKTMISDQLAFVRVSKQWFTADDFRFIRTHRIGSGKIGGKAAGMLLAYKILQHAAPSIAEHANVPESYFIGADVFYDFLSLNKLQYNQKYKTSEQIQAEYPQIKQSYEAGRFPDEIADRLRDVLEEVGNRPIIVRSSSLLEDNFGTSFAGKYESHFCANQGTPKENLRALTTAIRRIYASVYSPDALFYRRHMGLLDYDERMAIMVQIVQGQNFGQYHFPTLAGVAFSRSPIVWSPRLRREDGFVRLVMGLGTRAVNRVADDYPRLITLSHPLLRPETTRAAISRYSQHYIDVIDLHANEFVTRSVKETIGRDYQALRWIMSVNEDDTLMPVLSLGPGVTPDRFVVTFDNLLQKTNYAAMMREMLTTLAKDYNCPVEIEFAASITGSNPSRPEITIHLLQCRPQSSLREEASRPIPTDLAATDRVFIATQMVPHGHVSAIDYLIYVDPLAYSQLSVQHKQAVARSVGRLNNLFEEKNFIMLGPGRWGSTNIELGVPVTYADIYHARALVELAFEQEGITPEPSYGTHFFQDLVEAQIYPLAVYPDQPGDFLNRDFLGHAHNHLTTWLPEAAAHDQCLKVIHIDAERPNYQVEISMNGERALAYLAKKSE
jgi:hypothetical protein